MWSFLQMWFVSLQGWKYPLVVCLTTFILTLVLHSIYKNVRLWFYKNDRYILCAFIEAIYIPFLVFTWIISLLLLYNCYIIPNLDFVFLTQTKIVSLYKIILFMLVIWFMMRFVTSMQNSDSSSGDYMKNKKMMRFLSRLFYYMLILLSIFGGLSLLGISFPERFTAFGNSFIVASFSVVLLYFSHIVLSEYTKIFATKNLFYKQIAVQALRDPIKLLIVGIVFNFILTTWQSLGYLSVINPLFELVHYGEIMLITFFWILYRVTSLVEEHLLLGHLTEKYPDRIVVQTASKFGRVIVVIIAVLILFTNLKSNHSSFFTVFGGSAVFFGIVGKDIFPDYLGGVLIHIENRFKVGEWVYLTDKNIEGTVEVIELRYTAIRTFDKRLLVVPNTFLISNALCNASRMTNRRIKETIHVERVSHNRLAKIIRDIRLMLENHSGIDQEQIRMVHFIKFGAYSFDINLYTFTKTTDWMTYRNVQQDVFLKIMEIVGKNGAKLAFPTRTLHMDNSDIKKALPT